MAGFDRIGMPKHVLTFVLLAVGGAVFGILSSLVNTSPLWAIPSKILGMGWSWAALGIVAAALVPRAPIRSALMVLLCAVFSYYGSDLSLGLYASIEGTAWDVLAGDAGIWAAASVLACVPLGMIGAALRRPDVLGVLARLAIPVGAAVEYFVLRLPGEVALQPNPVTVATYAIVATAGTVCAIAIVVRAAARGELRWPGTRASRPDPSAG
ncbi:hypothetical protein [Leifsonia xyli]|uniref:hypothetical protein n=1 Tax=Leifsonia xyli TaxID=1575 RepID=UPI003D6706CE